MEFRYEYPYPAPSVSSQCSNDPDLIFLREDLADELGAIIGYLECAEEVRDYEISRQFQQIAGEEEGHFFQLLKTISALDPVQGEEFRKKELLLLPSGEKQYSFENVCKGCAGNEPEMSNFKKGARDRKHYNCDEHAADCLRKAIADETRAINAYEKQIEATGNQAIQSLLVSIMNKEKEHLAIFIKIYFDKG